ncbi:MAG TPA: hypothetical protein VFV50_07995, partial [Bdellovibrionales bacterium]|nr:hypothetical protein [Bdellovibrionales bacterium]
SLPERLVRNQAELMRLQYAPKPLVGGSCESPAWTSSIESGSNLAAFYSVTCVLKPGFDGWQNMVTDRVHREAREAPRPLELPKSPEFREDKPRPWLWWLAAGLATAGAYMIYENNRPKSETRLEPTHNGGIKK